MTRPDPNRVQADPAREAISIVLESGSAPAAAPDKAAKADKTPQTTSDEE